MARVLINEFAVAGKKVKRTYAIYGGLIPPYTMKIGSDKYIMPGWYKLDKDEELPNIEDIGYYPYKPKIDDSLKNIDSNKVYKVTSSKGDKEYQVQLNTSGSLECSCPGYGFRRRCRHITEVQSSL
jgi:hypothetical protein|tara:strand:- start:936 stop:1313 length:378 start_codon:yes stop_codon:yes gene_type:complete